MKEVPNNEISEETVPIPEEILSVSKEELLSKRLALGRSPKVFPTAFC